jgi:serine/threonine-protein kinase
MADQPASGSSTRSDPGLRPATGTLADPTPSPAPTVAPEPSADGAPRRLGRYEVQGEVGRGGMGCVLRARDPDLNRELALKLLLEEHHGSPDVERRFLEEAQVGGQLQHPGVVPVHELGRSADGRPFFTMKLVRGDTLAALLAQRRGPADELPRYLGIFEQVCQTVAYAHAHGVLHRDLKPANVMVGAFGEVQVMDWGLAKVIGPAGADEAGPGGLSTVGAVQTGRSGPEEGSRAGTVLGTPAYMAPEQARGEVRLLDRRTDVFGLGAILCEILTGQPPYAPGSGSALLRAAEADLADALSRLDGCGADAELLGLARACLAPAREARPADAGAVAARAAAYREGVQQRLRQAELDRATAQAKAAEARKRQRLTVALAAAVVLALSLAGGGAWYVRQQQVQRQAEQAAEVRAALDDAERRQDDLNPELAWAALVRAEARLAGGDAEALRPRAQLVRGELERRRKDRRMRGKLDEARLRRALPGRSDKSLFDNEGADRVYAEAFRWYGVDVERLNPAEAAAQLRGSALAADLLDALDDWARAAAALDRGRERRLRAAADGLDGDGWRRRLRRAVAARDAAEIGRLAGATPEGLSASAVVLLADALKVAHDPAQGLGALRAAQLRRPDDFWLTFELAHACYHAGPETREEALRYYTAALALRPANPVCYGVLSGALYQLHRLPEAEAACREALRLQPDDPGYHLGLGDVLAARGKPAEAETAYRAALRLQPNVPETHVDLGHALKAQNQLPEAVAEYREALRLRPDDAGTHNDLGNALQDLGKPAEAEAAYRTALRLQPDFPEAHNNLGSTLAALGKLPEAVAEFREAVRLHPDFPEFSCNLGAALRAQGKPAEAEAAFREALRLRPDDAQIHFNLGAALQDLGKSAEAEAAYRAALRLQSDHPQAHFGLGLALAKQNQLPAAAAEFREALRLKPDLPEAHTNLGNVLQLQGKLAEAVAEFKEALRLKSDFPQAHYNLGYALAAQNKPSEAAAEFREASRLKPDYAEAHHNLGLALAAQNQLPEAVAAFREALRLKPDFPEAHFGLGLALTEQNKPSEAAAAFREALRLRPDYAEARFGLGVALNAQDKPAEAEAAFREALRLRRDLPDAHYHLGVALHAQGKLAEAVADYKEALRLQPDDPRAYFNLGAALRGQGQFAESLRAFRRGHELSAKLPGRRPPSGYWVFQAERLVELDEQLPALLRGDAAPRDAAERLELARLCSLKRWHAASARFYADAFAARPKLADDTEASHRYNAACAAALAGCGRGEDAAGLPDKARQGLRRQARAWLDAERLGLADLLKRGKPEIDAAVRQRLRHWEEDADLAGVRDRDALEKLPEAERDPWQRLWSDVAALRKPTPEPR